jgi:hypothetical protein
MGDNKWSPPEAARHEYVTPQRSTRPWSIASSRSPTSIFTSGSTDIVITTRSYDVNLNIEKDEPSYQKSSSAPADICPLSNPQRNARSSPSQSRSTISTSSSGSTEDVLVMRSYDVNLNIEKDEPSYQKSSSAPGDICPLSNPQRNARSSPSQSRSTVSTSSSGSTEDVPVMRSCDACDRNLKSVEFSWEQTSSAPGHLYPRSNLQ